VIDLHKPTRVRRAPSLALAAVVVMGVVAFVTACGSPSIDPDRLSADLRRDVGGAATGLTAITCPSGQPAKAGTTFTCTATTTRGDLVYEVTVTSDAGDYRYALAPGQTVDSAALGQELTAQVSGPNAALGAVTVTCPASIVAPGGAVDVTCTASSGTSQVPMHVTGPPGSPLTWVFVTA